MAQFQCSSTVPILKYRTEAQASTIWSRYVVFLSLDAWNKDQICIENSGLEKFGAHSYRGPYVHQTSFRGAQNIMQQD